MLSVVVRKEVWGVCSESIGFRVQSVVVKNKVWGVCSESVGFSVESVVSLGSV